MAEGDVEIPEVEMMETSTITPTQQVPRKRKGTPPKNRDTSKTVACTWPGCDRVFVKRSNMRSHLSIRKFRALPNSLKVSPPV